MSLICGNTNTAKTTNYFIHSTYCYKLDKYVMFLRWYIYSLATKAWHFYFLFVCLEFCAPLENSPLPVKGCTFLTHARLSWPLNSEGSLACYDNSMIFIEVLRQHVRVLLCIVMCDVIRLSPWMFWRIRKSTERAVHATVCQRDLRRFDGRGGTLWLEAIVS